MYPLRYWQLPGFVNRHEPLTVGYRPCYLVRVVRTDVLHSKILYWLLAVLLAVALLPLVFVSWRLIAINRASMAAGQRATQSQLAGDRALEIVAFIDRYLGQTASLARG